MTEEFNEFHVAIVGMSARFAGSRTPDEFWRNVRDGVECVTDLDDATLRANGVPEAALRDPLYVKRAAVLDGMKAFDAGFFGFTPKEAAILDPQHRHFLECAWEAMECAGHPPGSGIGPVGVFAGNGMHAYMMYNLISNPGLMESEGLFLIRHTGNDKDFLSTRASYAFDLRGPSMTVQTACSTSLVAIHMAAQSLLNGEIDMALAGGVTIEQPHEVGYRYTPGEILSPDGRCRPFDADSQGTVFGSGCGVVALRRLADAMADGDTVYAVLAGSAINNDGASKVGYLAPSVEGQARCVAEALEIAEFEPESIGYIECHGTGTPVGDPIEVAALRQAFGLEPGQSDCVLGSVKANIGHADTAAGVAGAMKVALALHHGVRPPLVHFQAPNPQLDLDRTPFSITTAPSDWPDTDTPRRGAVNSLGVGGTNAFALFEQAPASAPSAPGVRADELMVVSARSPRSLDAGVERMRGFLAGETPPLHDVAWTLQQGRARFAHRAAFVASRDGVGADVHADICPDGEAAVAFVFAGGGAQYPNMGRALYDEEPAYRAAVDECLRHLASHIDFDLRALLYPEPGGEDAAATELQRPTRTLPALFVAQYAQAKLWMAWGVTPTAVMGHSMGEYTAACLAGVFSLPDALSIVALRGKLFEQVDPGAMLSVQLDASELEARLVGVDLAAVNAPGLSLASGPIAAIEKLEAELAADGIGTTRIRINVAAHSAMLDPVLGTFRAHLQTLRYHAPTLPLISNLSGDWANPDEVTTAEYWVRHLREPVRFADGARTLLTEPRRVALEVGPGHTMATLTRLSDAFEPTHRSIQSSRRPDESGSDLTFMLGQLGALWCVGVEPDWEALHRGRRRLRVPVPTYAWDHEEYWFAPGEHAYRGETGAAHGGSRDADPGDWIWEPSWRLERGEPLEAPPRHALVVTTDAARGSAVRAAFARRGVEAAVATPSDRFVRFGAGRYGVEMGTVAGHAALLAELDAMRCTPGVIVDLRAGEFSAGEAGLAVFEGSVALAAALSERDAATHVLWSTDGLFSIGGEDLGDPVQALAAGVASVAPAEAPAVSSTLLDTPWGADAPERIVAESLTAFDAGHTRRVVARRDERRWERGWQRAPLPSPASATAGVGAVLITGGFGGLGLAAAERLGRSGYGVALVGRTTLPAEEHWDAECVARHAWDPVRRRIESVRALRAQDIRVSVHSADVADGLAIAAVAREVRRLHGAIVGTVHTAGVLDDDLMVMKSLERLRAVLRPKVDGTRALEAALADDALDFFVVYSSVSAVMGLPGQADYAAANAFLDAWAEEARRRGVPATAVGWPAWREVGMAVEQLVSVDPGAAQANADAQLVEGAPLGMRRLAIGDAFGRVVFTVTPSDWVVGEHRLADGTPVMPGAGMLELFRAALVADAPRDLPLELEDVRFLAPLRVEADSVDVHVDVHAEAHGWLRAEVWTDGRGRVVHATTRCRVSPVDVSPDGAASPALGEVRYGAVRKRMRRRVDVPAGPLADPFVNFGTRWSNLRRIDHSDTEALLTLALPPECVNDLETFRLHPALLDFATAGGQLLVEGARVTEFLVPMAYERFRFSGPVPVESYSHVRVRDTTAETVVFDVDWMDQSGRVFARAEGFTMRRLAADALTELPETGASAPAPRLADSAALRENLAAGIDTDDGLEVLVRGIGSARASFMVSPEPLPDRLAPQTNTAVSAALETTASSRDEGWVAPRDSEERAVAAAWEEALGATDVGAHADFFALGGHSLSAIRVASRLNALFGVELPLRTLFEAPTVAALAERIRAEGGVAAREESGSEDGLAPAVTPLAGIPRLPDAELYRPSHAQEGLWFVEQLQPGNRAYNIPMALRLEGPLDVGALGRALDTVRARHDATRMTFVERGGTPWVRVAPAVPEDLVAEPAVDAVRYADAVAAEPFDLAEGPLFRARLGQMGIEDHVLVLVLHHIVADEWSLEVLYDELGTLYAAELGHAAPELPVLPARFTDFSDWHRQVLSDGRLDEQRAFWKQELREAATVLEVPGDRPRPPVQSQDGKRWIHTLTPEAFAGVHALAQRTGTTAYLVLLGLFQTYLARLTGQEDVIVASPSSLRTRPELEQMVGFFVNTVAFRGDLWGNPTVEDIVARTKARALNVFANSDLPFDDVVRSLHLERDPSRSPLFQVMFALFPSRRVARLPGVNVTPIDVDAGGAQVDLTLYIADEPDQLRAIFEYNTALFSPETVATYGRGFDAFVTAAVEAPQTPVAALPLTDRITRAWLAALDGPAAEPLAPVAEQIAKVAATKPEADAVADADGVWSYAELDRVANRVAHRLRAEGVLAGDIVGVCLRRDRLLVAALLGIWRAGATYLPLDPDFPADRLAYMLRSSAAQAVLVQEDTSAALGAWAGLRVEMESADGLDAWPATPLDLPAAERAYVIYTSGSTGLPKGVMVPHSAVANFLAGMRERPGFGRDDCLVAVTTISFDISVLELFLPLVCGGKVVVLGKREAGDASALAGALDTHGATVLQATPATWRLLLQNGWDGRPSLTALCGGEALPRDLADALRPRVAELWNMYGPTETTVWSTCTPVTDPDDVRIGDPIRGTSCYVLDENGTPVPPMVPGRLWIGGEGVTLGYLGRRDLTAERFRPDPFSERADATMYDTGDRVRRRHDGSLEYLSRFDDQVKVRGFRIELGEVETTLAAVDGVRRCVVTAPDFGEGDVRLAAYVIPEGDALAPADLRAALGVHLPDYMVPSLWVTLESFPLTPNGKVDRRRLPDPRGKVAVNGEPTAAAPAKQAALSPTEERVAAAWRAVLGDVPLDSRDNFFDLGGHSLLAMRMIAAVEAETGVRFNPLSVSLQTLGQLAAAIDRENGGSTSTQGASPDESAATDRLANGPTPSELNETGATEPPAAPGTTVSEAPSAGVDRRTPSTGPAPGEHRRLLKKAARRLVRKLSGREGGE